MILMLVPLAAFLLGVICGGRPEALLRLPLRWTGLIFIAFGIQWVLVRIPTLEPSPALGVTLVASYSLLLIFMVANGRLPGLSLAAVGTVLNLIAIVANGGFMPTTAAALAAAGLERPHMVLGQRVLGSKDVLFAPGSAVFGWLGDTMIIVWPIPQAFSVGDILVAVGVGALVFLGTQPRKRWTGATPESSAGPPPGAGFAEAQPTPDPGHPTQ